MRVGDLRDGTLFFRRSFGIKIQRREPVIHGLENASAIVPAEEVVARIREGMKFGTGVVTIKADRSSAGGNGITPAGHHQHRSLKGTGGDREAGAVPQRVGDQGEA